MTASTTTPAPLTLATARVVAETIDAPATAVEHFASTGDVLPNLASEVAGLLDFLDTNAETADDLAECMDVALLLEFVQTSLSALAA